MARYTTHVRSPRPADEAFAYMADLTNFAEWDPGVTDARQTEGDGPGEGAAFDVTVKAVPRPLVLTYRITAWEPDRTFTAVAESSTLRSVDTITVAPHDDGCTVTYDAELTLRGVLALADPVLRLVFGRIGDRATAGLVEALDGAVVPAEAP